MQPRRSKRAHACRRFAGFVVAAAAGTEPFKLRIFMAHEITIGSLLAILGAPIGASVPWAANVQIQLLESQTDATLFVRVLFDGRPAPLAACPAPSLPLAVCPLDTFQNIVSAVLANATRLLSTYCNQTLAGPTCS